MLESVFFFQNFKAFGVSDSLGERIGVLSIGNVWSLFLRIGSRSACHVHRVQCPRVKFGKQECGSLFPASRGLSRRGKNERRESLSPSFHFCRAVRDLC